MVIWLIAAFIFVVWLVGTFVLGMQGFIHVLLLCAVSTALVQFVHDRRAARH